MEAICQFVKGIPGMITGILPAVLAARDLRHDKEDGSYVTNGDLLLQERLIGLLGESIPEATIISEELSGIRSADHSAGVVVVIDPIDGTENFTSGLPEWGVSVACYADGVHVSSLIGCPELDTWLWTGLQVTRFRSRIRGLSSSLNKEELQASTAGYEYRILGCCVYNMINVVRGSFCSFENPRGAASWDILAGLNLALEHGLTVTVEGKAYAGEYLPPNKRYRFKIG